MSELGGEPDEGPGLDAAWPRFQRFLTARRLKATRERREILDDVAACQDHFDVRALQRRMRAKGRSVSRATLYRTIDLLVEAKLLRRLEFGDGEAHYELLLGRAHHDHLYCGRCGRIIEFKNSGIERVLTRVARENGFLPEGHWLRVTGTCRRCQAEETA